MDYIKQIYNEIILDKSNQEFTNKQWIPIFMANPKARILIIGQAPGLKTQENKLPFKDKSGDILRTWLGVDEDTFYCSGLISVLPMDFYFPGKGKTGDLPPRKDFASKWHPPLISLMPDIKLVILIGTYAQNYYLKNKVKRNLTKTVKAYQEYLPTYFVLAHPSPLNFRWFKNNPSFLEETIPVLKTMVQEILQETK